MNDDMIYCETCNSDPFTISQRCVNFNKTLAKFHLDQGHAIVPFIQREITIQEIPQKLELSKCDTVDQIYKVIQDFQKLELIKKKSIKYIESKKWENFEFYSDVDDYQGIPITVKLDYDVAKDLIKNQNENSYHVKTKWGFYDEYQWKKRVQYLLNIKNQNESKENLIGVIPNTSRKLKESLRETYQYDIDKEKTIDSDIAEFKKYAKGGFHAYEEKNTSQHFSKDFVSDIMLPAHVYNGKESCKKWKTIGCLETNLHSNNVGYIRKVLQHCNYKGCKKCATNSINREAGVITNRLMTFCNLKNNRKIYLKKNRARILLHTVVSIPYEEYYLYTTKEGRKKLRTKSLKYLKELDVDGGVMIDHPYRFSKNLESARLSPHFHFIITGWLDESKIKELYEKTGWIISTVSTIDTWWDCYGLARYLLSHSAVFMKDIHKRSAEHSIRYFGECHNKKFKVETVLKHSITGKEQIDSMLNPRRNIEKKSITYKLQKVSYTHSIINETIKDYSNEYFECYPDGNVLELSKSLRQFIKPETNTLHRDNPARSESVLLDDTLNDESETPSMKFLQMRFDYGLSMYDIVQSVYVNVVFDDSLDQLCPECSLKMQTIVPPIEGWSDKQAEIMSSILVDMQENDTIQIDDVSQFDYLKNVGVSLLGMPYFDFDGVLQYDIGVYELPENLDLLNPTLYWNIRKNITIQQQKYSFKLQNGRVPTKEELLELIGEKPVIPEKYGTIKDYF